MRFTDDEWMLMMLYSPGTRTGLIAELQTMQNMRHWICIRTNKGEEEKDR